MLLHGHGVRSRQVRGPLDVGGAPEETDVLVRRYRCIECSAVVVVVPRGLARRRLFMLPAILLALSLWAVDRRPAREVRGAISPHRTVGVVAGWAWTSLGRWARAAADGRLARKLRPIPPGVARRELARRVVHTVAAFAPPALRGATIHEQVFAGAMLVA